MKDDWEKAIAFVLKMEGGVVPENNPNDPGGLTKFGISQKAYPHTDIAALTVDDAKAIYRRDYWDRCRCDDLPTPFAIAVFDTAVNQGEAKARRILQDAVGVNVDGIIGQQTIEAAFKAGPRRVMKFLALRLTEYARTMAANPRLLVFATNWHFRVLSLFEIIQSPAVA